MNHDWPYIIVRLFSFLQQQNIMPSYDIKISKRKEDVKRRPSIQLCLSYEKPIFIISRNMNGAHILTLIESLETHKIPYQMQQETETLGFVLNQQFFLIVDNKYGEVMLGGDFSSKFMTIVGYPKLGRNNVCTYLQKPQEVIQFYQQFKDKLKMKQSNFGLLGKKDSIIMVDQPSQCKAKNKIQVKSIAKYLTAKDKQNAFQAEHSCLGKLPGKKIKVFILEDKADTKYHAIAENIVKQIQCQDCQMAESIMAIRKKTLFCKGIDQILYICNRPDSFKLLNNVFKGQVVIYDGKSEDLSISKLQKEPKIYGIAVNEIQILKLLKQIGLPLLNDPHQMIKKQKRQNQIKPNPDGAKRRQSFLLSLADPNASPINNQKLQIKLVQSNVYTPVVKQQDPCISIFETIGKETILKMQQAGSKINEKLANKHLETEQINNSSVSKTSVNQSQTSNISKRKKIKRLGKSKNKIDMMSSRVFKVEVAKKQGEAELVKQESILKCKKSLKMLKQSSEIKQRKKMIHFEDSLTKKVEEEEVEGEEETQYQQQVERRQIIQTNQFKKVKPIFNVCPEIYTSCQSQIKIDNDTNTSNWVYQSTSSKPSNNNKISVIKYVSQLEPNGLINGIFYRQFVPKFQNIINLIKHKPQILTANSCNHTSPFHIKPFVYMSQYDRHVRRLKYKLRQKGKFYEHYNFMIFLEEGQYDKFFDYCLQKNHLYNQQGSQFLNLVQSQCQQLPNISMKNCNSKVHVYLLLEQSQQSDRSVCQSGEKDESVIELQNIVIFKKYMRGDENDIALMKRAGCIREFIERRGLRFAEQM